MTEPLTSKPIADMTLPERLREFGETGRLEGGLFTMSRAFMTQAASEIERLTAELNSEKAHCLGVQDELYSVDKAANELGAERDRLAADLKECQHAAIQSGLYGMSECKRLEAERDRLADELQQLRACFVNDPLDTATALRAERDRLRAALERIAAGNGRNWYYESTKALKEHDSGPNVPSRAPDETTERPYCPDCAESMFGQCDMHRPQDCPSKPL